MPCPRERRSLNPAETHAAVLGERSLEVALLNAERQTRDVQVVTRVVLGKATCSLRGWAN